MYRYLDEILLGINVLFWEIKPTSTEEVTLPGRMVVSASDALFRPRLVSWVPSKTLLLL